MPCAICQSLWFLAETQTRKIQLFSSIKKKFLKKSANWPNNFDVISEHTERTKATIGSVLKRLGQ